MLCYDCLQDKHEVPAVAVCTQCGRALCQAHAVRQEAPAFASVPAGMGLRADALPKPSVRFLCRECAALAAPREQ